MTIRTSHVAMMEHLAKGGAPVSRIAGEIGCSPKTVRRHLGQVLPKPATPKPQRAWPVEMILHDWNADKSLGAICRAYRIQKKQDLYNQIQVWRRQGLPFKKRSNVRKG